MRCGDQFETRTILCGRIWGGRRVSAGNNTYRKRGEQGTHAWPPGAANFGELVGRGGEAKYAGYLFVPEPASPEIELQLVLADAPHLAWHVPPDIAGQVLPENVWLDRPAKVLSVREDWLEFTDEAYS